MPVGWRSRPLSAPILSLLCSAIQSSSQRSAGRVSVGITATLCDANDDLVGMEIAPGGLLPAVLLALVLFKPGLK